MIKLQRVRSVQHLHVELLLEQHNAFNVKKKNTCAVV